MEKKYELTDETIKIYGRTLHHIRALRDFGNVKAGDLGGFVESERNLSQEGTCWVSDEAIVCGNAVVCGEAQIFGKARVFGIARVFGKAKVYTNAVIGELAQVFDKAEIHDNAELHDSSVVCGDAIVRGEAQVFGRAKIYDKAQVYGEARIYREAQVFGETKVGGKASIYSGSITSTNDYICIGPIGSRNDFTTFFKDGDKIMVKCGCFKGDIEEFKKVVEREHSKDIYGKQYIGAIQYLTFLFS